MGRREPLDALASPRTPYHQTVIYAAHGQLRTTHGPACSADPGANKFRHWVLSYEESR
ncbi:hypothetical protein GCM10010404_90370 [Nonomuraea africana]|uniref:Uncharacterized protein n=1 Tax=Nonomuraea africana TaxID=46171 RepID=A0ABR9KDQ9_9ACTN|nr:hypothetical protein [Nonomuraea africana]